MTLGPSVSVRLSAEKHALYESFAAVEKKPLARYLRDRLERDDQYLDEQRALRHLLEHVLRRLGEPTGRGEGSPQGMPAVDRSPLLEVLLLLRQTTSPDKLKFAQSELRRLGLPIWTGEDDES